MFARLYLPQRSAWQPADDLQLDLGANKGVNRHASDIELDLGVARRF